MKQLLILLLLFITIITTPSMVFAQSMMGNWGSSPSSAISDDHTAREEEEGKEIWKKLQAKQFECKNLTDEQYGSLGEYFMGQSIGDTEKHAAMNKMMISMMGEAGQIPQSGVGFMPMMWMMEGGGNPMMGYGGWNNMMGGWNGFGFLGWLPMLLFWILLILGVVALLRYLGRSGQQQEHKTPLDILKERYALGEIEKKEFEEKKKDLT